MPKTTRLARVRATPRLLDEQQPRVRERRELCAEVLLQLGRERARGERLVAPRPPRYSTRIQWSTRLAVAETGSPLALETAAQNARLVVAASVGALTAATVVAPTISAAGYLQAASAFDASGR